MEPKDSLPPFNAQILEEAAYWLVEFNAGEVDAALQQRFRAWLRTSPEHVRAYLELLPIWEGAPAIPLDDTVSIESLIALGKAPDNVVPLDTGGAESPWQPPLVAGRLALRSDRASARRERKGPRRLRALALASCFLLIVTAASLLASAVLGRESTYETGVGQQQSISLADGSTIELNARSKVRIRFTRQQRDVVLLEGQAFFWVAKDPTRPFVVDSEGTRIRAVGTQFDVYRKKTGTTVTVVEGRVAVLSERVSLSDRLQAAIFRPSPMATVPPSDLGSAVPLFLDAGEEVTVTSRAESKPKRTDVAAAIAWTQHRLVFDASTLAAVIDEFNRYNTRRLVLRDQSLASFPITGTFSSTDPSSLVRFLQMQPGIRVTVQDNEIEVAAAP